MKRDFSDATIEHEIADLRTRYPGIERVVVRIERGSGDPAPYSACLDIRRPQQQTLVSGPMRTDLQEAVRAAFVAAAERLRSF